MWAAGMAVLKRGLGFIPTKRLDTFKLRQEQAEFFGKVRLRVFFDNKEETPPKPSLAQLPHETAAFEQAVTHHIDTMWDRSKQPFMNLSRVEEEAIRELNQNTNIFIKPAEKGGAVVILEKEIYYQECWRLLSDHHQYKVLVKNPSKEIQMEIRGWWKRPLIKGGFCKDKPMTPYFYFLLKKYKPTRPPPGHPIVSGIGSVLDSLSQFCDFLMRPLVENSESYLKDTKYVLNLINEFDFDPKMDFLVGLDVQTYPRRRHYG
ncbi:hypothetical protein NDU88_004216 [Pleurodeles waltl]|uniref:Uncharacterized protein n=1 Tax=Pleurodeles waltl TaxID=8319 RepID=A0AAV7W4E7_PLEWA|nr:hypothetical protein NDU88_004216 [Pleurodeles waltl]